MSDLKIYGNQGSRTARCLWLAAELGLDFEHIEVDGPHEGKSEVHLARNPMGAVPVIDDGGFLLWESMAINLYLARKHGGPLAPANATEDARSMQWSFWVMSECETWMLRLMFHGGREAPDTGEIEKAIAKLERPLTALERSLDGQDYLLGDRFTVADINVASVFAWAKEGKTDFGRWPRIDAWLGRCFTRPKLIVDANPENW